MAAEDEYIITALVSVFILKQGFPTFFVPRTGIFINTFSGPVVILNAFILRCIIFKQWMWLILKTFFWSYSQPLKQKQ